MKRSADLDFAARLRNRMKQQRVGPTVLARDANVSRAAVTQWLSGKNKPNYQNAARVAEALNLDPDVVRQWAGIALDEEPAAPDSP